MKLSENNYLFKFEGYLLNAKIIDLNIRSKNILIFGQTVTINKNMNGHPFPN